MTWINTFHKEMEFPQNYNAAVADQNNMVMMDWSCRIFNTDYRISRPGAEIILESGLGMSMSCA